MKDPDYTNQEIEDFLNIADFDLVLEIHEEQMIPEILTFEEFFKRYKRKYFEKYKKELITKL